MDPANTPATSLQRLVHRHYVRSALITILAIDLVLVVLYFAINAWVTDNTRQTLAEDARHSLLEIVEQETTLIDTRLREVSHTASLLQHQQQTFFASEADWPLPNGEPQFAVHANGVFYKQHDNGGASLYYSSSTPMGAQQLRKARNTEALDTLLVGIVESHPIIAQAYLNTWDGMNRLYPFMPDAPGQYGPVLNMQEFNFYYLADATHNPAREPVWTSTYLDPAGQGWMASCVVPIYRGDFLEGVTGLDITVSNFVEHVLNLQLPWGGQAFMVDASGMILAMPPAIEDVLGLRELKSHVYNENIGSTVLRPEEYNLLRHPAPHIRSQLTDFLARDAQFGQLQVDGRDYLIIRDRVEATGWWLITLVDSEELFASVRELERTTHQVGLAALGAMLVFYLLFFAFLNRSALNLASRISAPLRQLGERSRHLGSDLGSPALQPVGIHELDRLSENFNQMVSQLEERTRKLIDSQTHIRIAEERAQMLAENALTDHLTGLANRARMEEILAHEIERASHNQHPFAVIMIDVDHFKQVNDQFGHETGDQVMIEMARLFRLHLRPSDRIGRWGGEEFLLVCPHTGLHDAHKVAERLRSAISSHVFDEVGSKTISLGVALYTPGSGRRDLVQRADRALYRAKHNGRNRVELDDTP